MFGEKLKELRTNRNIFQKDLAEYIGVSRAIISQYESGDKYPSIDTIEKIAEYFGVTIDYLLGSNNTINDLEEQFPEGVQVLRRATKELTPEARAKMVKLMKAFLEEE